MILSPSRFPVVLVVYHLAAAITALAHTINLPASLVSTAVTVETVATGISFGEGPATDPAGNLYFTDRNPSRIWKVPPGGKAEVFRNSANDANGMVFDREGRLVICEKKGISRIEKDSSVTILFTADTLGAEGLNDLTLISTGGIFFTSSVWNGSGKVFYLSPDRHLTTLLSFSSPPLNYPNGIEYVEEKRLLYVNITRKDSVVKYRVNDDMSLSHLGPLCGTPSPDGLAIDVEGNLWVANTNGNHQVTVFDSSGVKQGEIIIDGQESIQNCAFGGPDRKTLYITGKTAVFSIQIVIVGRSTSGVTAVVRPEHAHAFSPTSPGTVFRREMKYRTAADFSCRLFDLRGASIRSPVGGFGNRATVSSGIVLLRTAGKEATCLPLIW